MNPNSAAKHAGSCIAACLSFSLVPALAQTPPQAGTLLKEIERTEPKPPAPAPKPGLVAPKELLDLQDNRSKVLVRDFRVTGASLIPEEELKVEVAPYIGRELTLSELRRVALLVSDVYRRRGLFARALIPQQRIQGGVVEITIIEGRLSAIDAEVLPGSRISGEQARHYIESQQAIGEPLHPQAVQTGLRNLNELPGAAATGVLQPGDKEGDVKLNLRLDGAPFFSASAYLDNYGLKATGKGRVIGYGQFNSPGGYGDQITLLGVATDRSDYLRAGYSLPLDHEGLRLGVSAARLDYRLGGDFAGFKGRADIQSVNLAKPLYRDATANVFGGLAYEQKHFINTAVGEVNLNDKVSNTWTLSLYGDFLDALGGGASNSFNVSLVSGRLDLSKNPGDQAVDSLGVQANGGYNKVAASFTRLNKLSEHDEMYFAITGQGAGKNLDSFEKMSLGGPTGVRAYPSGEALGDEGAIVNLEWRHALSAELQGSVFFDAGYIRVLNSPFSGWNAANPSRPNTYGLQGAGFGLQYNRPNDYTIRAVLAGKIGSNPGRDANGNDADGGRSNARAWVQLVKFF